jgi:hypothetical protein
MLNGSGAVRGLGDAADEKFEALKRTGAAASGVALHERRKDAHPGGVRALCYVPAVRMLFSAGYGPAIQAWDLLVEDGLTPAYRLLGHSTGVTDLSVLDAESRLPEEDEGSNAKDGGPGVASLQSAPQVEPTGGADGSTASKGLALPPVTPTTLPSTGDAGGCMPANPQQLLLPVSRNPSSVAKSSGSETSAAANGGRPSVEFLSVDDSGECRWWTAARDAGILDFKRCLQVCRLSAAWGV